MGEQIFPAVVTNFDGCSQSVNLVTHAFLNRTIYLFGAVDDVSALNVITQMRYLARLSDDDIVLCINSAGGSVSAGMAIYDVMKHELHCDVCTVAVGMAASMGAFLLASGTKGKRYAAPEAEVMIHQPLGCTQGQATDISRMAGHIQRVKKRLASLLADACGKPVKTLLHDTERDNWKTAGEAVQYGLVDHIGFPGAEQEACYE